MGRFSLSYREGTCPHCHGDLKQVEKAQWQYACTRCGRCWIILDKIYWLAGFDAAGEIWKIKDGEKEQIPEYEALWNQLWDRVRNQK